MRSRFLEEYEQHVPLDKVIEAEEMKRSKGDAGNSLRLGQKRAISTSPEPSSRSPSAKS
ncbi:MAG: hypothetical protein R2881_00100 [Eubacteriales bacterium]